VSLKFILILDPLKVDHRPFNKKLDPLCKESALLPLGVGRKHKAIERMA
jgi:ribosomal protein L25 (general stress protein Ctc)